MGTIAQVKYEFLKAINYYKKALNYWILFKDWHNASICFFNLGRALESQNSWIEAVKIYIQALAIDIEHSKEWIGWRIKDLARMLKQLGKSEFEAIWREVTGGECDGDVKAAIWSARDNLETE